MAEDAVKAMKPLVEPEAAERNLREWLVGELEVFALKIGQKVELTPDDKTYTLAALKVAAELTAK